MCETSHMSTNIEIDEALLTEALRVGGHRTKKATVNEALAEYVLHRKQSGVLPLFGTVEMDPTYNYKTQRKKR